MISAIAVVRALVIGSVLAASTVMAQDPQPATPSQAPAQSPEKTEGPWYLGPLGIHIGGPIRASVGLGAGRRLRCSADAACSRETIGFASLEPGLRGGRFSLGAGMRWGGLATAATARATFLQRWGSSSDARYLGLEMSAHPVALIGFRLGAFRPMQSSIAGSNVLWMGNFSIGL
jgi:hypothetical protein